MSGPRDRDDIHLHVHIPPEALRVVELLARKLNAFGRKIDAFERRMERHMSVIDDKLDAITASVDSEVEVSASVLQLLTGLNQQIVDLKDAVAAGQALTPEQTARFDEVIAKNEARRKELVDAVLANTPATPPAEPPTEPATS